MERDPTLLADALSALGADEPSSDELVAYARDAASMASGDRARVERYLAAAPAHRDRYRYESQRRILLDLLAGETDDISAEQRSLVRTMDAALQGMIEKGDFIDDPVYAPVFDPDRFWYLYGTPS